MLKVVRCDASDAARQLPARQPQNGNSRQLFGGAALLAVLAALALSIDLPVAQYFHSTRLPRELGSLLGLSETFAWGGTVALIIATAWVLDPRGWRIVPGLAAGAYLPGIIANGMKMLCARQRPTVADLEANVSATFLTWLPFLGPQLPQHLKYRHQSFPSGHAATAAGLAVALAALYPRGRWLFALFAVLASVQRLDTDAHFLSDVLAGAALGCLVGAAWQLAGLGRMEPGNTLVPDAEEPSCGAAHARNAG